MPSLIPANACMSQNFARAGTQSNPSISPQSLQPLPQTNPPLQTYPSDASLHRELDDQIQLVKQIQKILANEQNKLEKMLAEFHDRSNKRKQILLEHLKKSPENPISEPKRLRVCSPYSINRNMVAQQNLSKSEEKQSDTEHSPNENSIVELGNGKSNKLYKPEEKQSDTKHSHNKNSINDSENDKSDNLSKPKEKQSDTEHSHNENSILESQIGKSANLSICSDEDEGIAERRERKDLERFRNFWSSCGDMVEDEEIDIKEELNCVVIEDLVVEELTKRRKMD